MELAVMRLLAAEARAAGRDPARDPVPGLRRDVLFASHGRRGGRRARRGGLARRAPTRGLRAAGALNECGGVSATSAGGGSTRSRSPRRASPSTGSPSAARGATARCRARTTRRSSRRRSSRASRSPARSGSRRSWRASSSGRRRRCRPRPAACPARPLGRRPGARRGGALGRLRSACTRAPSGRCCATRSARTSSTPA